MARLKAVTPADPPADRRMAGGRSRRKAFTLIELLVVMAIICLLVSVLVPSLERVWEVSRRAVCASNLHQMSQAYITYSSNYRGKLLPYICDNNYPQAFWMNAIRSYYGSSGDVRCCPKATQINSSGWGTAFTAWGRVPKGANPGDWLGLNYGSYAINGWMYDMSCPAARPYSTDWHAARDFKKLLVPQPANVPLFSDGNWVDTWPYYTDQPYPDLSVGSPGGFSSMGRVCIMRHDLNVNVACVSGNVRLVSLPDLYLFKWCTDFQPTVRLVP